MRLRLGERAQDERGASFIIALVLTLVCVVVSIAIMTSASVSVERDKQYLQEQQAYFAVRSAAKSVKSIYNKTLGRPDELKFKRDYELSADVMGTAAEKDESLKPDFQIDSGADSLGIAVWAREQVNALRVGGTAAEDKIKAEAADVPGGVSIPDTQIIMRMKKVGDSYIVTGEAQLSNESDYSYNYKLKWLREYQSVLEYDPEHPEPEPLYDEDGNIYAYHIYEVLTWPKDEES